MSAKYNIRSKENGRFIKLSSAKEGCKCGKSNCSNSSPKIVAGRLYEWKGVTVRAFGQVGNERLVMAHKTLAGLVPDSELKPITKDAVEKYLSKA